MLLLTGDFKCKRDPDYIKKKPKAIYCVREDDHKEFIPGPLNQYYMAARWAMARLNSGLDSTTPKQLL